MSSAVIVVLRVGKAMQHFHSCQMTTMLAIQVYDEIDLDGDGRVSYREFVNMMKFAGRPITTREQD